MPAIAALTVTCSECANEYRVKPEAAGRAVKCPKCHHRNMVEASDGDGDGAGSEDPAMEWLGLAPVDDAPPAAPREITAAAPEPQRPLMHRDAHGEPKSWPMLRGLRITYFVLAALTVLAWLYVSGRAVQTILRASPAPEFPAGVPEGATFSDPGLTSEQRKALTEYDIKVITSGITEPAAVDAAENVLIGSTLSMVVTVAFFLTLAGAIGLGMQVQDDTRRTALYASRIPVK